MITDLEIESLHDVYLQNSNSLKVYNPIQINKKNKDQKLTLKEALTKLFTRLKSLLSPNSNHSYELECRLGKIQSNKFVPGVSKDYWTQLLSKFHSYDGWVKIIPRHEVYDHYYSHGNNKNIRTRVSASYTRESHEENDQMDCITTQLVVENCKKCTIESVTIQHDHIDSRSPYDIKLSLSQESKLSEEQLPAVVHFFNCVRLKQREIFEYRPEGFDFPIWNFEFSLVWTGKTLQEAEKKREKTAPIYEIECELLNPTYYLTQMKENLDDMAIAFIVRIYDILGIKNE